MRVAAAAGIAAALLAPLPASALLNDHVEFWVAQNETRDTNVLRISDQQSPTVIGALKRSDTISTSHIGVSADIPWSQQRVQASYTYFASRYHNFLDLNNNGHSARAQLMWGFRHRLTGTVGYNEAKGLSSFSNIQSRVRDIITNREAWLTASWEATPRYRASGALTTAQNRHSALVRRLNDVETVSTELGLTYVTPVANSIGLVARVERGRLPNTGVSITGALVDNAYRQFGTGATLAWVLSGHSRFDGRAEWVRRIYEQATERNYGGPIIRALYTWTPTGKLTINAAFNREFGAAEEITSSLVLQQVAYIRPRWTVTDKVTIQANLEYQVTEYTSDLLTGLSFTNRGRLYGASVTYRPLQKMLLSAGVNREVRTSSLELADYEVTVGFIEGRIGF